VPTLTYTKYGTNAKRFADSNAGYPIVDAYVQMPNLGLKGSFVRRQLKHEVQTHWGPIVINVQINLVYSRNVVFA
jgi:hypothetical protein